MRATLLKANRGNRLASWSDKLRSSIPLLLVFMMVVLFVSACGTTPTRPSPTPMLTPQLTITPTIPPTETLDSAGTATPAGGVPEQIQAVEGVVQVIASRTPVSTATPDRIEREITEIVNQTELGERRFLDLSPDLWINILASIVLFTLGYVVLTVLLFRLLNWLVKHTKTNFDNEFLESNGRELKWLVVLYIGRFAIMRLDLWQDAQLLLIDDIFFFLIVGVLLIIALRLIRFAGDWLLMHRISEASRERLAPLVLLFKRLGYLIVLFAAASITLAHLGINVTWLAGFLLLAGLIIALGAREVVEDLASGILILMDPPYRAGDDIYIQEINAWGRVVEIGLRNTRLCTPDNRMVIVPNTQIGKNQIINYSLPVPTIRIHTDISLAYESDINLIRQVIEDTVRGVEDVVLHKPINVYFLEFTEAGRAVRVQWWINSVNDRWRMLNRVNSALEEALEAAGIVIAYTTINIKLQGPDDQYISLPTNMRSQNGD